MHKELKEDCKLFKYLQRGQKSKGQNSRKFMNLKNWKSIAYAQIFDFLIIEIARRVASYMNITKRDRGIQETLQDSIYRTGKAFLIARDTRVCSPRHRENRKLRLAFCNAIHQHACAPTSFSYYYRSVYIQRQLINCRPYPLQLELHFYYFSTNLRREIVVYSLLH